MKKTAIIIPARYQSSRFPGKPLALLNGKPMLQHVWEKAIIAAADLADVYIATDDQRILEAAERFGASVVMTAADCRNGSERVYQAGQTLARTTKNKYQFLLNLQGDTPLIPSEMIRQILETSSSDQELSVATIAVPLSAKGADHYRQLRAAGSSSGTFVVFDSDHQALYFSSSLIPHHRESTAGTITYKHLGIYLYRSDILERYIALPESRLEKIEKLEQLRLLENRIPVKVLVAKLPTDDYQIVSVDAPEDLALAAAAIKINENR